MNQPRPSATATEVYGRLSIALRRNSYNGGACSCTDLAVSPAASFACPYASPAASLAFPQMSWAAPVACLIFPSTSVQVCEERVPGKCVMRDYRGSAHAFVPRTGGALRASGEGGKHAYRRNAHPATSA